jgi:lysozyme
MPKINAKGLDILESSEGCHLTAYPDPGSGGEPYTICYGATAHQDGSPIQPGETMTQTECNTLLEFDLQVFEEGVNNLCARPLNTNQFSALVSFAYNEGVEALATSTLMALVNAGHFVEAANQFQYWVWSNGQVIPGLITRRAREKALFLEKP